MLINQANLRSLYTGFSTAFQGGFAGVAPLYNSVATTINSTTAENEYGWLGQMPGFREWIGDRVVKNVSNYGYTVRNRTFEQTISVKRDHIEDDNIGIYTPLFAELGRSAASFPDTLVFPFLASGFSTNCYDKQYFFDTDHPVLDANGAETSVSNFQGGSGTAWYLLDVSRALKPLIFQSRRKFDNLIRKDQATDDNVFDRNEYVYGNDGRCNVGFGFWQMAYGSKQTLNAANYAAARAAMLSFKADGGTPLGIMPKLLVVPPSLEGAAKQILQSQLVNGGESNPWAGTAEMLMVPWLS